MAVQTVKRSAYRLHEGHSYSCAIQVAGNTPLNQTYVQGTGSYDFDRTMINVTVTPVITCDGTDLDLSRLSSKSWYEIATDGTETQITSSTPGYELYPSGYPCGLRIKKNGNIKLLFRARHDKTLITATVEAREMTAADPLLELELDAPSSQLWNPFVTGHDTLTITPRAHRSGKTVAGTSYTWKRLRGTSWTEIKPYVIGDSTTEPLDCDISINSTTGALTIDRRYMGENARLQCTATAPDGMERTAEVSITRRIPAVTVDTIMSAYLPGDGEPLHAEAYIRYEGGNRIADPSAQFLISWHLGNSTTPVGYGNSIDLYTTADSLDVGMGIEDRGALGALCDLSDNAILTDENGNILFD